jgi:MinD superfamily P-loop ATPase
VNKYDINRQVAQRIAAVAKANDVPLLGQIPYDPIVTRAQLAGQSVVEYANGSLKGQVQTLWQAVLDRARSAEKEED